MTAAYVDTSCLLAVAFGEAGYEAVVTRLQRVDRLFASNLLEAEFRSALRRESVEGGDALLGRISWVIPHRPLTDEMRDVLASGYLRGADLWHLACALYLSPDPQELLFLTLDGAQSTVATMVGFTTDAS